MKKINKKGFTLIELLVVIAIIGLLSTMAVISLSSARAKSRDAKRVSDVKQIATLLSLAAAEVPDAFLRCNLGGGDANCADGNATDWVVGAQNTTGDLVTDPVLATEFDKFLDPSGYVGTAGGDHNACNLTDDDTGGVANSGTALPCQYALEVHAVAQQNTLETVEVIFMTEGTVGDMIAGKIHSINAGGVMKNNAAAF